MIEETEQKLKEIFNSVDGQCEEIPAELQVIFFLPTVMIFYLRHLF